MRGVRTLHTTARIPVASRAHAWLLDAGEGLFLDGHVGVGVDLGGFQSPRPRSKAGCSPTSAAADSPRGGDSAGPPRHGIAIALAKRPRPPPTPRACSLARRGRAAGAHAPASHMGTRSCLPGPAGTRDQRHVWRVPDRSRRHSGAERGTRHRRPDNSCDLGRERPAPARKLELPQAGRDDVPHRLLRL